MAHAVNTSGEHDLPGNGLRNLRHRPGGILLAAAYAHRRLQRCGNAARRERKCWLELLVRYVAVHAFISETWDGGRCRTHFCFSTARGSSGLVARTLLRADDFSQSGGAYRSDGARAVRLTVH